MVEESSLRGEECPPSQPSSSWLSSASDLATHTGTRLSRVGRNVGYYLGVGWHEQELSSSDDDDPSSSSARNGGFVKERVKYAWNWVRYGRWKERSPDPYMDDAPIWLLGMVYHPECSEASSSEATFRDFLRDYYSRIWLTYRIAFPAFPDTTITSDCGWGCTLRSMQMLLAQTLVLAHLGREWRWRPSEEKNEKHARIIRLFDDDGRAPVGLHRLMAIAARAGKDPIGQWYAPSNAAILIRTAVSESRVDFLSSLAISVCTDGCVVLRDLEQLSLNWTRSVLLIVSIRLGTHKINQCYYPHIRNLLALRNTVGIVGGRPRHSLYFVGWYHKSVICLDPHRAHKYHSLDEERCGTNGKTRSRWKSFHCLDATRLPIAEIDPSCAVGLLFRSQMELEKTFKELNMSQVIDMDCGVDGLKRTSDPIFTVMSDNPRMFECSQESLNADAVAQAREHGFELL